MLSSRQPDVEKLRAALLQNSETLSDSDWTDAPKPTRDWKKSLLIVGLGALSWVATYVGMLELIQANMGELDLATKVVIGCSVAMLMTMIIWLLDQLFAPLPFTTKFAYFLGYVFLTVISVGFGFGFYWKVLESRSEASRSAESAVTQVQGSLVAAGARLDQLRGTLGDLATLSARKAVEERERGTTCPNSRPGDGPRRKLRDADAARFEFASSFVTGRAGQVKADLKVLDGDLKKIATGDPSTIDPKTNTRNAFLRGLERKLELTSTRFNAFRTDPQLRQIRSDLNTRAAQTIFPTGRGNRTFSCPDPQLQAALRGVVRAIDQLPVLAKPTIATVEGSEAVIEAFRRLSATFFGALAFKLPPSADEMRELRKRAVRQAESNGGQPVVSNGIQGGLTQRDYIPLAIALFVDLCLLLVSIGRPMNRMDNLVPRMRSAEQGPVYRILSKFSEIHRDPEIREKFEVFSHVVFTFNGSQYVAVPLDAPRRVNPDEYHQLRRDAHLLRNLFVSFEKEKIVKPIVNPLLRTAAVQRILEKQGSAFAKSPAFQLYRFQDGAWADIILGAVMGAAKRVETQRLREQLAAGPSLGFDASEGNTQRNGPQEGEQPATTDDQHRHQYQRTASTASEILHAPADISANATADTNTQAGADLTFDPMREHHAPLRAAQGGHVAQADMASHTAFGPYAGGAARDFAVGDADVRAGAGQMPEAGQVPGAAQAQAADQADPSATPSAYPQAHREQSNTGRRTPRSMIRETLPRRLRRLRASQPVEADIEIRTDGQGEDPDTKPAWTGAPDNVVDIAKRRRIGGASRKSKDVAATPNATTNAASGLGETPTEPTPTQQPRPLADLLAATPEPAKPVLPPALPTSAPVSLGSAPTVPVAPKASTTSHAPLVSDAVVPTPAPTPSELPPSQSAELRAPQQPNVTVRITERTADVMIPVSEATVPSSITQGVRTALAASTANVRDAALVVDAHPHQIVDYSTNPVELEYSQAPAAILPSALPQLEHGTVAGPDSVAVETTNAVTQSDVTVSETAPTRSNTNGISAETLEIEEHPAPPMITETFEEVLDDEIDLQPILLESDDDHDPVISRFAPTRREPV